MDELIRKQDVLELPRNKERNFRGEVVEETIDVELIKALPPVQPNHNAEVSKMVDDLISRQAAQHKINALIDKFETIMKDIRERHVDDSVCGLCEYDGAFMSDSGNWCNECPGFERDDCFKLKDQYREEWAGAIKNLPPVQPTQTNCEYCHTDRDGYVFPLEKNSHAFIDRDKIVLKANGWRGEAKIKCCPICGRRLADE